MQIFATLVVAATAVLAQQIGSEQGPSVSSGEVALSNPNVNNGWQSQNSLINNGQDGGNVFHGLQGNTFNTGFSNSAISDSNFINPSQSHVAGNSGATTNGQGNFIGDFFAGGPAGFHKRDAVFNNFGHGYGYGHGGYDRGYAAPAYERPVYAAPVYERPVYAAPVYERPAYERPAYERPAYERLAYERPAYERPAYERAQY
ncbi:hypothetical protein H4R26_004137 [Coemansia thaxteri]|uniref:Uncharacterized protein n=1 Tax=Coemansia thaxteri TaxID=2663907 RepID=A0A9W8BFH0_9FUNG|nr:hypothetical protein H4R26_004137 [Coemansia thaxteri]